MSSLASTVRGEWTTLTPELFASLPPGIYMSLNSRHGSGHMPVWYVSKNTNGTDDEHYTHILAIAGVFIRVDEDWSIDANEHSVTVKGVEVTTG